jgi:asparagine synthase (glutamine-hydrolysing)
MSLRERGVHVVYNGEIYNFRELRAELEADGYTFAGHSDTEVLLSMYAKHGHAMLNRLNGIFALAIYDEHSKELFIARDQLGVKPLYYTATENAFGFASEMKALLRTGIAVPELDPAAVLSHLGYLWSPGSATVVKQVRKLEPGYAMIVKDGRIARHWCYFDLSYNRSKLEISPEKAAERVAEAVKVAVNRQMVADVPVGAFLSGGLDSSAIATFAQEAAGGRRLQCFTIDINGGDLGSEGFSDDLPYAQRVAKHLDVDLHTVRVGPEMADRLEEMIYFLDEPTPDPAAINALYISELARSQGITVLLSGAGGDDIFTGYRRHYALQQERYWSWLPGPARAALARMADQLPTSHPLARRVGKAFQYAGWADNERLASYFLWAKPELAHGLLSKEFAASLPVEALLQPMLTSLERLPSDTSAMDKMLYLECKHFLADHNLNYTDKMGMAAGIEVRVPLLDMDLVALASELPAEYKQRGRVGKWIFKKAMEPYLPHDVIWRPKTGFGVPLRQWLQKRLRPIVDDALSPSSIVKRGIFDPDAVQKLLKLDREKRVDATYTIFGLVCMELWCRQYIDGNYALSVG